MNDFDLVKQSLNILQVITQETGLQIKGKHLAECPFCHGHDCFSVQESEGFYKCFQCDAKGDIFTFLESYHNLDKSSALKKASELAGIQLKGERIPKDVAGMNLTIRESIFLEAAEYYHGHMLMNGGRQYLLDQRGHREETLRAMKVGWSDGALVDHLKGRGFSEQEILASSLAKTWKNDDGNTFLTDFFSKNLAIFPHINNNRIEHFTIKDPQKKLKYQLPAEARSKEWRFYNQSAFQKHNEIIIVEGENDTLSIMDAGINHVAGLIGSPADYQIKALKSFANSKHIYLWLDNDEDPDQIMTKGKGYIRRICQALAGLSNVRVITYNTEYKDPDEYIQKFHGDRKKEIKRLQIEAVDYITWEINQIAQKTSLEERLKALKERKIFAAISNMVESEKQVFTEKITALGFTQSAIEELLESNQELRTDLNLYLEGLGNKKDADPNVIAAKIFHHFTKDGRFFYDRMNDIYLLLQHHTYQVGNNRPFNALVKRMTGLLPTKEPGRSVWESLASEAYSSGKQIDIASWITTDRSKDTIYVNLNSSNNIILKISGEGIEEIPNGLNPEGVLLKSSRKIMPFNYLPDTDVREGMRLLKELVFDNLTCEKEQKYLILCWIISAFLLDFAPYMALMKFSGATSSGKTTAARLLSLLIYGNEHLGDPSAAAAYAVSSQNPLLIIDNLESDDFTKSILKFLLLSAVKGGKEKRTAGTETETTEEQPKALVLITAIEPFTKSELINRTYDIEFSSKHKSDGFIEDEVIRALIKNRNLILSALIKFIQKDVLLNLEKRKEYIVILKKEYKNHSKNRTDEYLSTLLLMLDKMLKYIPVYGPDDLLCGFETGEKEIRKAWIEYQDVKAKDTDTGSNLIIKQLDGLVSEYLSKMKDLQPTYHRDYKEPVFCYTHPDYLIEFIKTKPESFEESNGESYTKAYIECVATAGEIVQAFDKYCKNYGTVNIYKSGAILVSRLKNDIQVIKKSGWEVISREGFEPFYTRIQGYAYWKLRKVMIRK